MRWKRAAIETGQTALRLQSVLRILGFATKATVQGSPWPAISVACERSAVPPSLASTLSPLRNRPANGTPVTGPADAGNFAGQDVLIHDPGEFQRRLAQRQRVELALPFAL